MEEAGEKPAEPQAEGQLPVVVDGVLGQAEEDEYGDGRGDGYVAVVQVGPSDLARGDKQDRVPRKRGGVIVDLVVAEWPYGMHFQDVEDGQRDDDGEKRDQDGDDHEVQPSLCSLAPVQGGAVAIESNLSRFADGSESLVNQNWWVWKDYTHTRSVNGN